MRTLMYLVRHGATDANLAKPARLQGRSDVPLAALGVRQAEATRNALSHVKFAGAYSSPLVRARHTAEIIAPYLAPQSLDAIRECDVGRWEGKDWDEIRRDDAEAYAQYMADPAASGYPDGETFADVLARTTPAFAELFRIHAGHAFLVVSHHVVNRTYLAATLGLPKQAGRAVALDNCGVSVVVQTPERTRVKMWNATMHLKELHLDE
jgi:broad specificity phosphatase PhoE